jgi:CheY-like chemotaxis protein
VTTDVGPRIVPTTACSEIRIGTSQLLGNHLLIEEGVVMAKDNYRSAPAVRVLVVEDFEPFRCAIRSIVEKRSGFQIGGEVSDGLEAVRETEKLQPDVILLDIDLPALNGIEVARQIPTVSPKSKVVFVTQESGPAFVQEALSLGAAGGVCHKESSRQRPTSLTGRGSGRQAVRQPAHYRVKSLN